MKRSLFNRSLKIGFVSVLICLLVIMCVSCQSKASPEELQQLENKTVTLIDNIKSLDEAAISSIYSVTREQTDLFDISNQVNHDILDLIFKNFTYEIKNVSIQGSKAYIDIIIHNANMQDLFNDALVSNYGSEITSGKTKIDMEKVHAEFINVLKKVKKQNFTKSVQLQYNYTDGNWQWQVDDIFLDAVTGGYYSIAASQAASGIEAEE